MQNLNHAGALSPEKILRMGVKRLATLIRPSGYYNQKAGRLKDFAAHICESYDGKLELLLDGTADELRERLLSLKGIGPETADSIILYAAEKPSFVIDAYTMRLGERLGWFGTNTKYGEAREFMAERLPRSLKIYNEFHALVVSLGKDFCKKKPLCVSCPVEGKCDHKKRH